MFKVSRHPDFFPVFICFGNQMSNSTIQCFRLYMTNMWPSEANRLTVRLCTQQDAQKRAASKCSGSSTQSSGTTSFILKPGVSWSQDGCRSSGHHKPAESHQVQSRTHKFSGGFPSFSLAKKSFHAASGPSPLTSPWPEQCLLLNWALAKSMELPWLTQSPFIPL